MLVCGLKLTHDGAVALLDDDKLLFSVEMEKRDNNKRFSSIEDSSDVESILRAEGVSLDDIDAFVVDGWGGVNADALAIQPRLTIGTEHNTLTFDHNGDRYGLPIAAYQEAHGAPVSTERSFEGLRLGGRSFRYTSQLHVAGHVFAAYSTSPFAERGESAYVLVWDGGMLPRLYYFDREKSEVENLGPVFMLVGNAYTIFSQHFGPFKTSDAFAKDSLSIAGKVMAYIAYGTLREEWLPIFEKIYLQHNDGSMGFANTLAREFKAAVPADRRSDEDVLLTFHVFLERLLTTKLVKKVARHAGRSKNLCLVGGCALNIKWNSALRNSGEFADVYVPPFPNDSGSAIGAACCAMWNRTARAAVRWSVYSGPALLPSAPAPGWTSRPCSAEELARVLHESQEPVVFLEGRAELGPRALGARSIIASPTSAKMKDILNRIKVREPYRPVSPICLEDRAPAIFEPGIPDPFMLFDHRVKAAWRDRIPAVVHLDGTARLQTIHPRTTPLLAEVLLAYEKVSDVPVLCNTSANYKGAGFFPDVRSATEWGGANYVFAGGTLYQRSEPAPLLD